MSPRLEKWTFRLALLGLVALVGAFVWQQTHDRPSQRPGAITTTVATTASSSTTAPATTATTEATDTTAAATPVPSVTTDPGFTVTTPAPGSTVDIALVEFVGTGPAGEVVHMGTTTATVGEDSIWRMTLGLQPGPNTLTFTVLNSDGTPLYTTATVTFTAP